MIIFNCIDLYASRRSFSRHEKTNRLERGVIGSQLKYLDLYGHNEKHLLGIEKGKEQKIRSLSNNIYFCVVN